MKQLERIIEQLREEIEGKTIIELACGTADFSLAAAKYAERIICLDLNDSRLKEAVRCMPNLSFFKADAAHTGLEDGLFDTAILYQAFYHIEDRWPEILAETKRILKPGGRLYVISSWKLDKALIRESLPQYKERENYYICKIAK